MSEAGQGAIDLNGDGDAVDWVLHVLPPAAGKVINVGLAGDTKWPVSAGRTVALGVWESQQGGQDLNGDGDALDFVLHLVDATDGAATNTGLAVYAGATLRLSASFAAVAVSEAAHGAQDLNGDGDTLDRVLHYVATSGAAVTNVGLAGQWVDLDGGFLVGNVKEDEQAQDLNGDGVLDDFVPHVVDAASGSVLALPAAANQTIELSAGRVAYRLREGSVGWTLNADFDLDDSVLQVLDVASGITTNTGLGCSNGFLADGDYLACSVAESQQEQDLNGDGDELDEVPHAVHLPTLTLTNTGLAASMIFGGLRGRLLTLDVSEIQQGQDLNGDGDTTDSVLHVLNLVSGSGTSVGQATSLVVPGDRLVGFLVREGYQGTPDLNGDGDTSDDVWHAYDAALGTTVNLGVAAYHFDLAYGLAGEDFLVVSAREPASGGQDFNGDGDSNDQALFLLRVGEALQNLGVAVFLTGTTQYLAHSDRRVLFSVSESNQGVQDLNGDGDTTDAVVHVLDVP